MTRTVKRSEEAVQGVPGHEIEKYAAVAQSVRASARPEVGG